MPGLVFFYVVLDRRGNAIIIIIYMTKQCMAG